MIDILARVNDPERVSLLRTLGISLKEIGDTHAEMTVTVREIHQNYLAGAHGGLIATLVDTVAFFPRPLLPSGRLFTTTGLNIAFLRPAALGETLTARSELLHVGRRTASVSCRVVDSQGRLVAHGTVALMGL
jgi:acyl-CoA thioesterase